MRDLFTDAYLTGIVQELATPDDLLAPGWFPAIKVPSNKYLFHTVTGARTIVPYRDPLGPAGVQKIRDRAATEVVLPYLREKKGIPADLARLMKVPGKTQTETIKQMVAEEAADLDGMFERTMAYVMWQLVQTGVFSQSTPIPVSYDFGLDNTATVSVLWSVAADAVPLDDIDGVKQVIRQSGAEAIEIIMPTPAFDALVETAQFKAKTSDAMRDELNNTGALRKIRGLNLSLYDGTYDDGSGDKRYLSSDGTAGDRVIIKAAGPLGKMVYGLTIDDDAPQSHMGKFVKSWTEKDPTGRQILECANGMPGLMERRRLYCLTVL